VRAISGGRLYAVRAVLSQSCIQPNSLKTDSLHSMSSVWSVTLEKT